MDREYEISKKDKSRSLKKSRNRQFSTEYREAFPIYSPKDRSKSRSQDKLREISTNMTRKIETKMLHQFRKYRETSLGPVSTKNPEGEEVTNNTMVVLWKTLGISKYSQSKDNPKRQTLKVLHKKTRYLVSAKVTLKSSYSRKSWSTTTTAARSLPNRGADQSPKCKS